VAVSWLKNPIFLQNRGLWFRVMFLCKLDALRPGSCWVCVCVTLTLVSFIICRRLWGLVALSWDTAMGPRLCGISVAVSRLQGLCCKAGSSALLNPYVNRLWDLVLVLGQSRRTVGI